MQAIILAAGMGKRLGVLTRDNTKCMIEVNGVTLIERMLRQLSGLTPALSKIVIVVGYESSKLKDYIASLSLKAPPLEYINNDEYASTNNIVSLALAKEKLIQEDTLLLESDLIFEDGLLEMLLDDPRPTLALVDKYESWMDGTVVKIDEQDNILAFVPGSKFVFEEIPDYYKTVNIYKFSRSFSSSHYVPFLEAYSKAYGNNEYYEQVLRVLTMLDDSEVKAKRLDGQRWYEIDDVQDLDIAASLFNVDEEENLRNIQKRYGGYWRYPKLIDFCYLVNPYYPPKRLLDEIKANFDKLISQYPSGARVNSLLAAKNFSLNENHVLVGNGAAEIIASVFRLISDRVGIVRPTFEEYPNRYDPEKTETFIPTSADFSYSVDDLKKYFCDKNIGCLVLINPDNPSGNYLPKAELINLMKWCENKSIRLIVDESFSDFADEENNSCLNENLFAAYPSLVVIKSISKSFGIPGLRLGIMATADTEFLEAIQKDLAIWNINSFGEFYLQIAEKYQDSYRKGLIKFREERKRFFEKLTVIEGMVPIPTQANFVMVELRGDMSSKELTTLLLAEWNILIKDLSEKINDRQFVRLSIRCSKDNNKLLDALRKVYR